MYKDEQKQKEANRLASQRRRDKAKGMTREGMTEQGMTDASKQLQELSEIHAESKTSKFTVRARTTGCKCAIPGDEDYEGVCQKIDGVWQVVKPEPIPVKDMDRQELEQAIRAYPNNQWINSPKHKELLSRLHSKSVDELESEGYFVPAWKRSA